MVAADKKPTLTPANSNTGCRIINFGINPLIDKPTSGLIPLCTLWPSVQRVSRVLLIVLSRGAVEDGVQLNLGQTWERHVHVGVQHLDQLGGLGAGGGTHVQDLHRRQREERTQVLGGYRGSE